jgi:hypothetical protein
MKDDITWSARGKWPGVVERADVSGISSIVMIAKASTCAALKQELAAGRQVGH